MKTITHFNQECPTCGRSLRIRVEYQGKRVLCKHCQGEFEACDPASPAYPPSDSGIALMQRAEDLLSTADPRIVRPK